MSLRNTFANALANKTGLTPKAADAALGHILSLLKTKVPPAIAKALDKLMASPNGVDAKVFLLDAAVDAAEDKVTEIVTEKVEDAVDAVKEKAKASWEDRQDNRPIGVIVKTSVTRLLNWFKSLFNKG